MGYLYIIEAIKGSFLYQLVIKILLLHIILIVW